MDTAELTSGPQTLMIDADDTLWENNIYFERAIAEFISFLNHQHYSREKVREVLNDVERHNIVKHGYGLHSFAHALVDTFEKLATPPVTSEMHDEIHAIAHKIAAQPVETIEGVAETLAYLTGRKHHLILMTKGNFAEQTGKVERSGLKDYFAAVEVVAEKDEATYRAIAAKYELVPETTWMIGNSPKSDVNPALRAGLNAVFVPHADTWVLEHEEVGIANPRGRLLRVEKFADLKTHF